MTESRKGVKAKREDSKRVLALGDLRNKMVTKTLKRVLRPIKENAKVVQFDISGKPDICEVKADLAFVFGGDGSILRAVQLLGENQIPIVGVNVGRLGFLTEFSVEEFLTALPEIISGRRPPSERLMICATLRSTRPRRRRNRIFYAVNEVTVSRVDFLSMVRIRLSIDGSSITSYSGDGVIVATPTGSTAYSLSCGGPILLPGTDALVITPISPHTLTNRPLVVPASSEIVLEILSQRQKVALSIDGQVNVALTEGDIVSIRKAERVFRLVENYPFYLTLREKLNWGGTPKYGKD
jgi:NAD+ kinase